MVCTMGPAWAGEVLSKLVTAGRNGPRLNFFPRQPGGACRLELLVRPITEAGGHPSGPGQPRSAPQRGPWRRDAADGRRRIFLSAGASSGPQKGASVNYPTVITETPVGTAILLADGNIELRVEEKVAQVLRCRVMVGGVLRSQVGINFPGHSVPAPALTPKDCGDLCFGLAQNPLPTFSALRGKRSPQTHFAN